MVRPNIILIFADDLGYGDVSTFNPEAKFQTPNLDRLASLGMKFTDSHATSALCTPSRYGLLTGRYNWRSRLKANVIPGDADALIEYDRKTLAQLLKDQGYKTAAVGKWHLGLDWVFKAEKDYAAYGLNPDHYPRVDQQTGRDHVFEHSTKDHWTAIEGLDIDYDQPIRFGPLQLGFDYFFGTPASLDQPPYVYIENDRVLEKPSVITGKLGIDRTSANDQRTWQMGPAAPEYMHQEVPVHMQEKVLSLLEAYLDDQAPFFLYYPMHLVHGPLLPSEDFKGKSGVGFYGDFVLQLDHYVGQIMDKLIAAGQFDNTVFIFTSDNGVSAVSGIDHLRALGHYSSYHFRGEKSDIWEGGHREPTIISYPPIIAPGTQTAQMVSHADIYRTIADLIGASLEDQVAEDSVSNLPLWQGSQDPVRDYIIHSSGTGGFSIRHGYWKLIFVRYGGGMNIRHRVAQGLDVSDDYAATELYDLRDDLSENHNVIDQYPELVREMTRVLAQFIQAGRSTPGQAQANAQPQYQSWYQVEWIEQNGR